MSLETIDDVLNHAGIKGMKWGVRNEKKAAKADKKWEHKTAQKEASAIFGEAATKLNADFAGIKAGYAGKNLSDPKVKAQYNKEIEDRFNSHLSDAAAARGPSPSGSQKLNATYDMNSGILTIRAVDIEHADDGVIAKYAAETDADGFITSISLIDQELMQSFLDNTIDDVLEHFGVKGMRWGVRKSKNSESTGKTTSTEKKKVSEMSDTELRATLNRMQMEKQYKEMTKGPPTRAEAGKKFVASIAQDIARQTIKNVGQSYSNKLAANFMATPAKDKPNWEMPAWAKNKPDVSTRDTSIATPPMRKKKK